MLIVLRLERQPQAQPPRPLQLQRLVRSEDRDPIGLGATSDRPTRLLVVVDRLGYGELLLRPVSRRRCQLDLLPLPWVAGVFQLQ